MKRRNDSQREARDLTSQDIQACCRRNARCSELKTLCDSQNHQLIASIHILKCAKKNCIGLPTCWGEKKKSCPTVCCITWLHFLLKRRVSLFGTSEDRVRSTPTVFVCLTLPWGQVSLGGGAAGLSWTGKLFLAQTGVGSDVTSASSSSGLGSSLAPEILLSFPVVLGGVEEVWSQPTLERQAGWRRWRWGLCRIPPFNTIALLWMTDAA